MNKTVILFILLFFTVVSCNKSSNYKPQGLRPLSDAELIESARARNPISENTVFKDSTGKVISRDELQNLNREENFGDQYVNANHEVVEVVIRKATEQDKGLMKKMKEAFEEGEPITILDTDCSEIQNMLEAVYDDDQGNRLGGGMSAEVDQENQQIVVSIIENCGFPTVEKHGHKSVEAVFLVIQHAPKSLREKYFPLIKQSADQGDLAWSTVALMEDRMLTDRGEKQKYGSQVQKKHGSDQWVVCPIEDPQNVNKRRAEVGLESIEEYLKYFGIDYEAMDQNEN